MDENIRKLRVLERTEIAESAVEEKIAPKVSHPNLKSGQTNPIYKNLAKFVNEKIAKKLSIKDLLR